MPPIIAVAIPFFFVLLGIELLYARLSGRRLHRFNDSIADLACGVGDQVLAVFAKTLTLLPYGALLAYAPHHLDPASPLTWAAGLIGVDFTYYWYHRFSHRVGIGWVTHVVHHQSEEYNLAVALRQSWFAKAYHWVFDLPLALLGVPLEVYASSYALNLLYQFWIHTRAIGRLGPLEWVLNTPSHHRVHHGSNRRYLDRNYAGILIVWDRLFGTFEAERDEPVYGTVKELRSWNPVWANVEPFVALAREAGEARTPADKLRVWLAPPEWRPASAPPVVFPTDGELAARPRYDREATPHLRGYVRLHFALIAPALMALMALPASWPARAALGAWIIASVTAWGGLIEGRRWATPLELARLVAAPAVAWLFASPWPVVAGPVSAALALVAVPSAVVMMAGAGARHRPARA